MATGVAPSVALQLSGHLRGLCESDAHFQPLSSLVAGCRAVAARCDLFVHTWDELYPRTPSWHTWYPSDVPGGGGTSSQRCLEKVRTALRPAAVSVERQAPNRDLGNATWIVVAGRHRETHVSLAGLRSAVHGVAAAAELRRAHERAARAPPYDVAVRVRPDLYHRRNFRRNTRGSYRGVPVNQICSVPAAAWPTIVSAAKRRAPSAAAASSAAEVSPAPQLAAVHGCDDDTRPGNKSGDMCFWSAPPSALDTLVAAWDVLADEYLRANLCWQRWREQQVASPLPSHGHARQRQRQQLQQSHGGRARGAVPVFRSGGGAEPSAAPPPCEHPETQWEGSAAELILTAAARREGLARAPLHGEERSESDGRVPRQAECT